MRKVVCGVLAFWAISAVAQVDKAEVTENPQTVCWEDSVKIYLERGRWNDKEALVKLAECYHKGNGVPQSSLGTIFMYMQVQEKGGMPVQEYLRNYAADDPVRLLSDAMTDLDRRNFDAAQVKSEILKAINDVNYLAIQSVLAEKRDKDEQRSEELLQEGIQKGSEFALLYAVMAAEVERDMTAYEEYLKALSPKMPMAYNMLGRYYWNKGQIENSEELTLKAITCFRKADERACLTESSARRWIDYYDKNPDKLTENLGDSATIKRLRSIFKLK